MYDDIHEVHIAFRVAAARRSLRLDDIRARMAALGTPAARSTIGCWITGVWTPSARKLAGLMDALEMGPDERQQVMRLLIGEPS